MNSTTIGFKLIIDNCSHLQKEDVKNSLGKRKSKTLLQPMCEWRENSIARSCDWK
jgi:hypothetical protein